MASIESIPEDLVELSPPEVAYQQWCPFPRLGWDAPTLKTVMKRKIINDAPDDQPISSFIYKGTGLSKGLAKKIKISQTKPQEVTTRNSDLEEEQSQPDSLNIPSSSSERDVNDNPSESPEHISKTQSLASSSAVPDQNVLQDEQEQSSSPYIPFALEDYTEEEVVSVSKNTAIPPLSENVKGQLQLLIPHLETDTAVLVQDAEAIRNIFNSIKNELPPQLTEILKPVAFIEFHEPRFSGAQLRLAAREAQKTLPVQEQQCVKNMISVKKIIDQLKDSPIKIIQKLTALNEKKEQLLSRLRTVEASIKHEEENLARIPTSLIEQKKLMSNLNSELQSIKIKKKTQVPGTAEEDKQQIADVDNVCLRALDLIKSMLDM
ncbi:unnamed protein product [Miscanthus lutarioriparius]|uniref:Uncharacterized protein n=1 Tax=Miscanthus lutarioriparius TaxID=422564 RepID=A0A811NE93_9POAL|nr:unnamed protein product [Miscanthus lutarioriparius]